MRGTQGWWRFGKGGEATRACGGFGVSAAPKENQEKHGVGDDKRNTMQGSGRLENNGSGGATMMAGNKEDEWRLGTSVTEKQRGGESEWEDEGHSMTLSDRQGTYQRNRSTMEAAIGFGRDDSDSLSGIFGEWRREQHVERDEAHRGTDGALTATKSGVGDVLDGIQRNEGDSAGELRGSGEELGAKILTRRALLYRHRRGSVCEGHDDTTSCGTRSRK